MEDKENNTNADQNNDQDIENKGNPNPENKGEDKAGDGLDHDKDQKDKKPDGDGNQHPDDDGEPKIRKRKIDFILERKNKKIEKLKEKINDNKGDNDSDEDLDEDDLDPNDTKLISKVVEKRLKPLFEKTMQEEDEQEIKDFLKDNPDFAKFEGKARKFMQHESRKHLPIKSIFYEIAGDDLLKIGAEREKKAQEEAKHSGTGGGSSRETDKKEKAVWDMTPEEFEAQKMRVRGIEKD